MRQHLNKSKIHKQTDLLTDLQTLSFRLLQLLELCRVLFGLACSHKENQERGKVGIREIWNKGIRENREDWKIGENGKYRKFWTKRENKVNTGKYSKYEKQKN